MTLDVVIDKIDFKIMPPTELDEIAQNVLMIVSTVKKSVPMFREFGISADALDTPIAAAQSKLTAEITTQVSKYEPRARVKKIFYEGDAVDGQLKMRIRLEIVEKNLRGGI